MEIQVPSGRFNIFDFPDKCPFCHRAITPNILAGHKHGNSLEVLMYCPDKNCQKAFLGYYFINSGSSSGQYLKETSQGTLVGRDFPSIISEISPSFITIYNQAFVAEQQGLLEICGVGYRKSFEFLIKDYTILNYESEKEKIEKAFIGTVINQYINDIRIKTVSKRAAWLGNDETHYIRKWEGKNLEDLKKLIDLTIHWIEMESLTSSFETEMPE